MRYSIFLVLVWAGLVLPAGYAQPQRRAGVWMFGNREGVDFSCGVPEKITAAEILSVEGATGLCDEQGRLLFYSNTGGGRRGSLLINGAIWNRNRQTMFTMGQSTGGGISSAQGGIVIPAPASSNRYYLFTVDELESIGSANRPHRGISYFLIDMSAAGGLGAVVQNISGVHRPAAECIAAARHSNGTDYWILTVDYDSRDLVAIQVSTNGLLPALRYPRQIPTNPFALKLSPDGRFLFDGVGLYRFNASNGSIEWIAAPPQAHEIAFQFSPQSRYLYVCKRFPETLIRYDLQTADPGAGFETIQSLGDFWARHMQTGPDGNIYINTTNFARDFRRVDLAVVKCPDSADPRVQFDLLTFSVDAVAGSFTTLPTFADFWFDNLLPELEIDTVPATLCDGAELRLAPRCTGDAYQWSTAETSATIRVTEPGEYRVSVIHGCFTAIETFLVSLSSAPSVEISYAPFDDFCSALPITLAARATAADSLVWSTGATEDAIAIQQGGQYSVTAQNACGQAVAAVEFPPEECCRVYVPNAFSPNNDGYNDEFRLADYRCPFADFNLRIFSRWGELAFETSNPGHAWNGGSGARYWPPGLYIWYMTYRLATDPPGKSLRVETGDLTLIR